MIILQYHPLLLRIDNFRVTALQFYYNRNYCVANTDREAQNSYSTWNAPIPSKTEWNFFLDSRISTVPIVIIWFNPDTGSSLEGPAVLERSRYFKFRRTFIFISLQSFFGPLFCSTLSRCKTIFLVCVCLFSFLFFTSWLGIVNRLPECDKGRIAVARLLSVTSLCFFGSFIEIPISLFHFQPTFGNSFTTPWL